MVFVLFYLYLQNLNKINLDKYFQICHYIKSYFNILIKYIRRKTMKFDEKKLVSIIEGLEAMGINFEVFLNLMQTDAGFAEIVKSKIGLKNAEKETELNAESDILAIWQKIYHEWFGIEINVSELQVPEIYNPEKHFLVLVAKVITVNAVVSAMRKKFKVYLFTENPDVIFKNNDRTPEKGTYLVLFNKNIEADEAFKRMSAYDLIKKKHKGITLLERLLLEVLYFSETKKHLDIDNRTLCSGSRNSGDGAPEVFWSCDYDRFDVDWCGSGSFDGGLCSRSVVS